MHIGQFGQDSLEVLLRDESSSSSGSDWYNFLQDCHPIKLACIWGELILHILHFGVHIFKALETTKNHLLPLNRLA